uniref:Uncharacterized protein n=1 Tax=Schistosoma japonicum TaxID=6182 RepID=C1L8I5_SCHJA|nr:hypothetical protein [Schistosoma japonicum]
MLLSRLSLLAPCRRKLFVSSQRLSYSAHQEGGVSWLYENYPVTFLGSVVAGGVFIMLGYTAVCVLKNPDLYVPAYDRMPRDEVYFNKHYFGAGIPERLDIIPPVRLHYDGVLDLPYEDKQVHPQKQ